MSEDNDEIKSTPAESAPADADKDKAATSDEQFDDAWDETGEVDDDGKPDESGKPDDDDADGAATDDAKAEQSDADKDKARQPADEKAETDKPAEPDGQDYWAAVAQQHPDFGNFFAVQNGKAFIAPQYAEWFRGLPDDVKARAQDAGNPYGTVELLSRLKADVAAGKVKAQPNESAVAPDDKPADYDAFLEDKRLESVKYRGDDGQDHTIAEGLKEYGELGRIMFEVMGLLRPAGQANGNVMQAVAEIRRQLSEVDRDLEDVRLSRAHRDAPALVESDDFKRYVGSLPPALRRVWTQGSSADKADVIAQYKREKGLSAGGQQADRNKAETARRRALHGSTVRDTGARTARGGADEPVDPQAAYDEAWDETGDVKD